MKQDLPETNDYLQLFLNDVPMLDVRAPLEFSNGAFPNTENHPLIDDEQRHVIGIEYKRHGQKAAIALGEGLVSGALRETRIATWIDFSQRHPGCVLYCFRGGMRSRISQRWLWDHSGVLVPRVHGGYKALRAFLINEILRAAEVLEPLVIGGRTGVGKTRLLRDLPFPLDLEALAWHRGSAFGRHATPQPTQIGFENTLAIQLLKHRLRESRRIIVEDESKHIGSRNIPLTLFGKFKASPLVILEASLEERIENTFNEYIVESLAEYRATFGETGTQHMTNNLYNSLDRIKKRLGGAGHADLRRMMVRAINEQERCGDLSGHLTWIRALLAKYYDPMYDYQLANNQARICFRGDAESVNCYIREALS